VLLVEISVVAAAPPAISKKPCCGPLAASVALMLKTLDVHRRVAETAKAIW